MKTQPMLLLTAVLSLLMQGCIATGVIITTKLLTRRAVQSGDTISMDYHADQEATWRAALAEAGALLDADEAPPEPAGAVIEMAEMRATVKPLDPQELGSRIEIEFASPAAYDPERAAAFLESVADRLHDFSELVRDFRRPFRETWEATLAQLDEMGHKPTASGSQAESDRGRVLVGDFWIEVEQVGHDVTRVHVFLRADATAEQVREANTLVDGIDARLQGTHRSTTVSTHEQPVARRRS